MSVVQPIDQLYPLQRVKTILLLDLWAGTIEYIDCISVEE